MELNKKAKKIAIEKLDIKAKPRFKLFFQK